MGRNPKPVEQHRMNGTFQNCRHKDRGTDLQVYKEVLLCPQSIKGIKAKEAWNRIVPNLCIAGLVSVGDFEILEDAFKSFDIANEIMAKIDSMGGAAEYLVNLEGKKKDMLKDWRLYMDAFEKIIYKFGITPVEAAKIKGAKKEQDEEKDAIQALINNG